MKKHSQTIKGYCAGILTAVLIMGIAFSANASAFLKDISVSLGGISIYVDGELKKPVDALGNAVEPMIYNGVTYLPVRALTNILTDKEVSWDGNTQSVYIGQKPSRGGETVAIDTLKPQSGRGFYTGKDAKFNILDKAFTPTNSMNVYDGGSTYVLDAGYSKISGKFVIPYMLEGADNNGSLTIYGIDQNGTETELAIYSAKAGDALIEVDVDISGCKAIRIASYYNKAFHDVTLTTA